MRLSSECSQRYAARSGVDAGVITSCAAVHRALRCLQDCLACQVKNQVRGIRRWLSTCFQVRNPCFEASVLSSESNQMCAARSEVKVEYQVHGCHQEGVRCGLLQCYFIVNNSASMCSFGVTHMHMRACVASSSQLAGGQQLAVVAALHTQLAQEARLLALGCPARRPCCWGCCCCASPSRLPGAHRSTHGLHNEHLASKSWLRVRTRPHLWLINAHCECCWGLLLLREPISIAWGASKYSWPAAD